jgi:NADH-quinone oxidoreductase subunit A
MSYRERQQPVSVPSSAQPVIVQSAVRIGVWIVCVCAQCADPGTRFATRKGDGSCYDVRVWQGAGTRPSTGVTASQENGNSVSIETFGGNWVIIALMLTAAFVMGMTLLILNWVVAPSKPSWMKAAPYESGIPNVTPVQPRYTARFYVVAMLFVIFDIEAIFLFPWAVLFDSLGLFGFVEMLVFIALLFVGYVYAWRKGALEWV